MHTFDNTVTFFPNSDSSCAQTGLKGDPWLAAAFITGEGAYPMFTGLGPAGAPKLGASGSFLARALSTTGGLGGFMSLTNPDKSGS